MKDEHGNGNHYGHKTEGHGYSIASRRTDVFIYRQGNRLSYAGNVTGNDNRGPEFTQSPGKHENRAGYDPPD